MEAKIRHLNDGEKPYENVFFRRRLFAFFTIALTVFCGLVFFNSITNRHFETVSSIDVSGKSESPEVMLHRLIANEIDDSKLSAHLEMAFQKSNLASQDFQNINLEEVRDSIDFRIAKRQSGGFRLTTAFMGDGSVIEKDLTRSLTRSLAEGIGSRETIMNTVRQVDQKFGQVIETVKINAAELHGELNVANQLVNKLNLELSDIHQSIEGLKYREAPGNSKDKLVNHENEVEFQSMVNELKIKLAEIESAQDELQFEQLRNSISEINRRIKSFSPDQAESIDQPVRIVNASMATGNAEVGMILESLNSLDLDSVQLKIGKLQTSSAADANRLDVEIRELKNLSANLSGNSFVVNSITDARTQPADSVPLRRQLLLFAMLASCVGFAVALAYRPEFVGMGFENTEEAENTLGLPVITTLGANEDVDEEAVHGSWANSLVRFCEIALFGFVLLTAILCLIQPDLRVAFFENPIFGMSKLSRLFF